MGSSLNVATAREAGLHYTQEGDRGIRRRRAGKGFAYIDVDGTISNDTAMRDRIRKLAIPPAYTDVWINPDPLGHIQATARDARGRKQYRYHERWRGARDESKFSRMAAFGRALPMLRARVDADLRKQAPTQEKVVAAVVRLLETTLIRVGNDAYATQNRSFGLTTLRNRHLRIEGEKLVFEFIGKSGIRHRLGVDDRRLARLMRTLQEMPGRRLFQYIDPNGKRRPVASTDVNAYLRNAMGEHFTAKDFRTWAGSLAAAKALAGQPSPASRGEARRVASRCVKETARLLGNTPAVCRSAYVHPAVLRAFEAGRLPPAFARTQADACERALATFLGKRHRQQETCEAREHP